MAHTSVAPAHFAEGDFRVGRVIRRSASMLSRHFLTFFIVSVVAHAPIILLARTLTTEPTDLLLLVLAWQVLGLLQLIVLGTLGEAVIVHAAFQDMQRRPVRLAESLNVALRRFLPIVGLAFVVGLLIELVVVFGFVVVSSIQQEYLPLVGLILLMIPGLILYAMWFVAVPACVVERLGPRAGFARSRGLTKGHRWKLCGLALLLIIPSLFDITFGLATAAGPIVGLIINWFCSGIWAAFAAVVGVVTYHDLRVVKEGIHIDQIAGVFD